MPRKKFEGTPYNPIATDLARDVAATGRGGDLRALQPISSVITLGSERLQSVGSTALKTEEPSISIPSAAPKLPEPTITKRFVVTRSEDEELIDFLLRLQKKAGTKVTISVFARAAVNVALQAEDQILSEIGEKFPLQFPSTHDSIAQGEYEECWMKVLINAIRKLPRRG